MTTSILALTGISKLYPGVRALDQVDLALSPGRIHALVGENGAGKSSLINVITGAIRPDAGEYIFDGASRTELTPSLARRLGISTVFQEFTLTPDLTIEENLFLGRELRRYGFLRQREMRRRSNVRLAQLGFRLPLQTPVKELTRAQQQMTEIAKALLNDVRLLILDEPTASLTEQEAELLFENLIRLKQEGVAILYVSHRMQELLRLADDITVLRDGRLVATRPAAGTSEDTLIELMTGRKADSQFPDVKTSPGAEAIRIDGLFTRSNDVRDVSLSVRQGEILGIAGLVGCGKSQVIRAAFGLEPIRSGTITVGGKPVRSVKPRALLDLGVCYFPADRNVEGLALNRPIFENAVMAALDLPAFRGWLQLRYARQIEATRKAAAVLTLNRPNLGEHVAALSGGNRQKVVLARGLTRQASVYLFDEPTVGIDVGAKREVYGFIKKLASDGHAVVVVSSELHEVLGLCTRAIVMSQGHIVSEHAGETLNETAMLRNFFVDTEAR